MPKGQELVSELARKTGVATGDVQRVLSAIGMSVLLKEASRVAGSATVRELRAKDLKLAVRLGKASIAV